MSKVIIALDFKDQEETEKFLDKFNERLFVKIGMELFYKEGQEIIKRIKNRGHKIFLDLKLHDIPNTVKKAMENLKGLDVDMINVHVAGGIEMMKAAKEVFIDKQTIVLGVTILTSLNQKIINEELLINESVENIVLKYADNASFAGLNGIVCAFSEVLAVHKKHPNLLCVVPGIRLLEDSKDDQKRVTTPYMAKEIGADYIVVGRSITQAINPVLVYKQIKKEFEGE